MRSSPALPDPEQSRWPRVAVEGAVSWGRRGLPCTPAAGDPNWAEASVGEGRGVSDVDRSEYGGYGDFDHSSVTLCLQPTRPDAAYQPQSHVLLPDWPKSRILALEPDSTATRDSAAARSCAVARALRRRPCGAIYGLTAAIASTRWTGCVRGECLTHVRSPRGQVARTSRSINARSSPNPMGFLSA